MKKIIIILLSLVSLNTWSQESISRDCAFTIVGKGDLGLTKCSGTICEYYPNRINVRISDMLEATYYVSERIQIDERTVKYKVRRNQYSPEEILNPKEIIKYKCPYGENVYFFTIPPMYEGQGRTVYKVTRRGY